MKKNKLVLFLLIFITFMFANKKDKGYEIMKKVRDQTRYHKTQKSDVTLIIKNKKGQERKRRFNHLKKFKKGLSSALIKFYQPANVKGTGLLSVSEDKEDDTQQWIYLPAFRSIKQLSAGNKSDSFMGSDFSMGDMGGRNLNQDTHTLTKETKKYFYITSVAKNPKDQYSKVESVINKKIYVPLQAKFYDKKGKLLKIMKNTEVKNFDGMYVVTYSTMYQKKTGGSSVLKVKNVRAGIKISDNAVSINSLDK